NVKPGCFAIIRNPHRKSCQNAFITLLQSVFVLAQSLQAEHRSVHNCTYGNHEETKGTKKEVLPSCPSFLRGGNSLQANAKRYMKVHFLYRKRSGAAIVQDHLLQRTKCRATPF